MAVRREGGGRNVAVGWHTWNRQFPAPLPRARPPGPNTNVNVILEELLSRRCELFADPGQIRHTTKLSRQTMTYSATTHNSVPKEALTRCAPQPRVAAPFFFTTSRQTFFKPRAHALATACARLERHTARTRALYAILLSTGRFFTASRESRARSLRRSHDQNFSTGFRTPGSGKLHFGFSPYWR